MEMPRVQKIQPSSKCNPCPTKCSNKCSNDVSDHVHCNEHFGKIWCGQCKIKYYCMWCKTLVWCPECQKGYKLKCCSYCKPFPLDGQTSQELTMNDKAINENAKIERRKKLQPRLY